MDSDLTIIKTRQIFQFYPITVLPPDVLAGGSEPLIVDQEEGHSRVAAAAKRREDVQRLKDEGLTKAEVARALAVSKQTVARHW